MKKLLLAILVSMGFGLIAQPTIQLTSADDTVYLPAYSSHEKKGYIIVENPTGTPLDIWCRRVVETNNQIVDYNYFCWEQCYLPSTDTSAAFLTLGALKDTNAFTAYVTSDGDGYIGCGKIRYTFWLDGNPSDSVGHTMYFCTAATVGLDEQSVEVKKIYPNPVRDILYIEMGGNHSFDNARVNVVNMLGSTVGKYLLRGGSEKMSIDVSDYKPGVYFLTLTVDGKTIQSQRFVVSK